MSAPAVKIGRLAMRHEGANWNAYYAMRDIVGDVIEMETGMRPTWPEGVQPAPQHERAGHS